MIGLHVKLLMINKGTVVFIPISLNARFNRRILAGVLNDLHLDVINMKKKKRNKG